jgi:5-methylcytosine-specific restriction endonuclease McrA
VKWPTTTPGEDLFLFIREDVLPVMTESQTAWSNIGQVLSDVGGSRHFANFFRGATAIHGVRRLLKFCDEALPGAAAATHVRTISTFATEEVFPGLSREHTGRLARLAADAYRASNPTISRATRERVLRGLVEVRCYLCGLTLDPDAPDGDPLFLSLDHIWPASLGGDHLDDNLLPACRLCQVKKDDEPSWEWLNVHNHVWGSAPSAEATNRVERQTRIARHFHHATELASAQRHTLKVTFRQLGPMIFPSRFEPTGWPTSFFDLQTIG